MSQRPAFGAVPEGAEWIECARLQAVVNPFRDQPWGKPGVTPDQVRACLARGMQQAYIEEDAFHTTRAFRYHAARIATLMREGWDRPLQLDVGIPELGHTSMQLVQDGHHRLAAAILANDPWICVDIAGSLAQARRLFGRRYSRLPTHLPASARTQWEPRLEL